MKYLANAFSLQMRGEDVKGMVKFEIDLTPDMVGKLHEYESFIGHQDTANVLGVSMHRGALELHVDDRLVVAQLTGKDGKPYRLPEGTTTLPEDAEFHYIGCFYCNASAVAAMYEVVGDDFIRNCYGDAWIAKFLWYYGGNGWAKVQSIRENGDKRTTRFITSKGKFEFVQEYFRADIGYDACSEYTFYKLNEDGTREQVINSLTCYYN